MSIATADHPPSAASAPGGTPPRERLGVSLPLLLVWLWFEFGRPSNPMQIPMALSFALFGGWLVRGDKRWSRQSALLVAFLLVMLLGIPVAANAYSAFWTTYGMAVILLCICLPLPSVVTSLRRIRVWNYTFVAVAVYVGVWAIFHQGFGPSRSAGGQDENYVAAMMAMAMPFAYFSIFAETRRLVKVLLGLAIVVCCGALVTAANPSRGGFLGLCAVTLYCLAKSPRKWVALSLVAVLAAVVFGLAAPRYWDEIATITSVHEGTADLRLDLWAIGMRMWEAHPLLGVGAANFQWRVGEYQSPEQLTKYGRNLGGSIIAHSLFVELLAEHGIVGVVIVAALLWGTWRPLRQLQRATPATVGSLAAARTLTTLRWYADAVIASMLACLVTGAFLSLLYYSYLWLLISLGSAIAHVTRSEILVQRST